MNTNNAPFRIGQRVLFLDCAIGEIDPLHCPKKGNIYTVTEVLYGGERGSSCPPTWYIGLAEYPEGMYIASDFAPIEESRERIKYVAVSETLREKAQEVVIQNLTTS